VLLCGQLVAPQSCTRAELECECCGAGHYHAIVATLSAMPLVALPSHGDVKVLSAFESAAALLRGHVYTASCGHIHACVCHDTLRHFDVFVVEDRRW